MGIMKLLGSAKYGEKNTTIKLTYADKKKKQNKTKKISSTLYL